MSAVKGVKRWQTLAKHLVYPVNPDAIQLQYDSDEDCIKAVVTRFVDEGSLATWRRVIWSLYEANEIQLADQIRSYGERLPLKGVYEYSYIIYLKRSYT